ncbi:MAG TPA: zf-HC2 domain-containing protein [Gaiellales bacterium]
MSPATPHELVCREVVELVSDYLEGAMTLEERARFEEHLAMCEGCSAYLEQMRLTLRVAGALRPEAVDPHVCAHLVDAFRDWARDRGG